MSKIFKFIIFTIVLFFTLLGINISKVSALSSYYVNVNYNLDSMNNINNYLSTLIDTLESTSTKYIILDNPYSNSNSGGCFTTSINGYSSCSISLINGDSISIKSRNRSGYTSGLLFSGTNMYRYELLLYKSDTTNIIYLSDKSTVLNQTLFPTIWSSSGSMSSSSTFQLGQGISYTSWSSFPISYNMPSVYDTNVPFVNIYDTYDFDIRLNDTIYSGDDSNIFPSWKSVYNSFYKFDDDISDDNIYEYSFNLDISKYLNDENIPLELNSYYFSKGGLDYQYGHDYIYSKLKAPFLRITYSDGSIGIDDNIVDNPDSDTVFDLNLNYDIYNRESNRVTKVELVYDMSYTTSNLLHIYLKSNLNFTTNIITDTYYHENNNLVQLVLTGKYAAIFSPRTTAINQDNNVNFELHTSMGFDIEIRDGLDLSNNSGLFGTDKNIKSSYYYYSVSKSNPNRFLIFYNLAYGKYNYGNDYAVTIWYNADYFTYTLVNTSTSSFIIHNDNTNEDVTGSFEEKTTLDNGDMVKSLSGKLTQFLNPVNYIIDRVVDLYNFLPGKVQDFFFISFLLSIIVIVIKIVT